ncbi:MAG: helix-turn-helix transcriptional regulator [Leifsonia flava]
MTSDDRELGRMLRVWRDRADPVDAGIATGQRRSPGLRREEVAAASGLSVDYLTRLEQGRARHPSAQVLAALARSLRLSTPERDHLFRLADVAPPSTGVVDTHVTPGVQRMVERMRDLPVGVFDARWTFVMANPLWEALMGPVPVEPLHRNLPWRHFHGEGGRVVHVGAEVDAFEVEMVADLRAATSRYPRDRPLAELVAGLRAESPRFGELWARGDVSDHAAARKTLLHPAVGELTLDCDVLLVQGSELRIVAYSAAAGSTDAEKLDLVRVLGAVPPARPTPVAGG